MTDQAVPGGVVHTLPADLRDALVANSAALEAWHDITPLARNEFICWVEDAKQAKTRERRIRRTQEELEEGMRRPCCWPGCRHRERGGRSAAACAGRLAQRAQPVGRALLAACARDPVPGVAERAGNAAAALACRAPVGVDADGA